MNGSLLNALRNLPTSWDWQGGEAAPSAIRTPWLSGAWHYDEFGRIVPNDPNNPRAPWNIENTGMSMEQYYDYMAELSPSSMFAINTTGAPTQSATTQPTPSAEGQPSTRASRLSPMPFGAQGGYGLRRSPLKEALRRLQGGM